MTLNIISFYPFNKFNQYLFPLFNFIKKKTHFIHFIFDAHHILYSANLILHLSNTLNCKSLLKWFRYLEEHTWSKLQNSVFKLITFLLQILSINLVINFLCLAPPIIINHQNIQPYLLCIITKMVKTKHNLKFFFPLFL